METPKRVAKNTLILYGRMAITVFISFYVIRLVLAALGTEDFGTYTVVASSLAMFGFIHGAMTSSTLRFMSHVKGSGNHDKMIKIFNVSFRLHLILALIVFVFFQIIGFFLFDGFLNIPLNRISAAKIVYQCIILSTIFTIISVPYTAVINARENMLLYSITSIVEVLLKLGIAIYLSNTIYDRLIVYGFLTTCNSIVVLLIQRIYCHSNYEECKISLRANFDRPLFKEMVSFGGWSFTGSFVSLIGNYGSSILINLFFGPILNAAQGIANQLNGQVSSFSTVMLKALDPVLVKSEGSGRTDLMLKASMTGAKLSFSLFAFLCVPVFIEMPFILNIWIKDYPQGALIFCRLLLIKSLLEQPFFVLITSIGAKGDIKKPTLYKMLILILPIPITYYLYTIGLPAYIIYVVFIICNLFKDFINLYFAKIMLGLSVSHFTREVLLKCLFLLVIMSSLSLIPHYLFTTGFLRLIVILIISTITFIFSFYLVILDSNERKIIQKIINSFFLI